MLHVKKCVASLLINKTFEKIIGSGYCQKGGWFIKEAALLANSSALSLLGIPQWHGIQTSLILTIDTVICFKSSIHSLSYYLRGGYNRDDQEKMCLFLWFNLLIWFAQAIIAQIFAEKYISVLGLSFQNVAFVPFAV